MYSSPARNNKSDVQKKTEKDKELQTRPAHHWKRVKPIGENRGGLNGGVFIVKDRKGKTFIEKRAKPDLVKNRTVMQEIIILKYLSSPSHPHITKMVDHYIDTKRCESSIYLEWCDLGGLNSLIEARVASHELFNEQDVWEWYIQLFSALTYCHYGPDPKARFQYKKPEDWQNGWDMVYHRDIKVDNILVAKGGPPGQSTAYTLKLADFGCAVARRHIWTNVKDRQLKNPWASRGWMAPEFPMFLGRTDVWQLGAVMGCICNVQCMPFFDFADPAPGYSRDLANAIATSMEEDHAKRPKADEVLNHVRERYERVKGGLERSPKPVPARIDKAKLKWQIEMGHERLRAERDEEKFGHPNPRRGPPQRGAGGGFPGGPPGLPRVRNPRVPDFGPLTFPEPPGYYSDDDMSPYDPYAGHQGRGSRAPRHGYRRR